MARILQKQSTVPFNILPPHLPASLFRGARLWLKYVRAST